MRSGLMLVSTLTLLKEEKSPNDDVSN
jgi:hypothetical protein